MRGGDDLIRHGVVPHGTRTSSVFGKTMQAFFAESTFPKGEGFWESGSGYSYCLLPIAYFLE